MADRRSNAYLWALGALSLMLTVHDGILAWHDVEGTRSIYDLSGFVFLVLVVLWVDADSRTQPRIYRPFEYGWFALFYWVPYLPYYFWRTRGAKGLLMLAGISVLWLLGWFVQWGFHLAR